MGVETLTAPAPPHWTLSQQRSEEHTSELQSPCNLVCRLLLEKKKKRDRQSTQCQARARGARTALLPRGRVRNPRRAVLQLSTRHLSRATPHWHTLTLRDPHEP